MANKNFFVHNGLTVGSLSIDAATGILQSASTASTTSTNTGALQVAGGVGIGGDLYVGGNTTVSNRLTIGSNSSVFWDQNYGINFQGGFNTTLDRTRLKLSAPGSNANGSSIVTGYTTFGIQADGTGYTIRGGDAAGTYSTATFNLLVPPTITASNNPVTYTNLSTLRVDPPLVTTTTNLTITNLLSIYATGGISITTSTNSTSTTTGALQVAGGVGVGGDLYVGGTVTATQLKQTSVVVQLGPTNAVNSSFGIAIGASAGAGSIGIGIGVNAGGGGQGTEAIAIGHNAGTTNQGFQSVALGYSAGSATQGDYSIAIGSNAGVNSQVAGSIIISATATNYIGTATNQGLYITPIRADATSSATTYGVYYNPVTKEVTTATAATGGGSTAGVSSVNGLTGTVILSAGSGITITTSSNSSTITITAGSTTLPLQLNDVSNQTNGNTSVFALKVDQDPVTSLTDSKNLEVIVDGRRLAAYVAEQRYPWITPYDSAKGFRVVSTGSTAQYLVIYNAPDIGSEVIITQLNTTSSKQVRKYPYSAASIALGD